MKPSVVFGVSSSICAERDLKLRGFIQSKNRDVQRCTEIKAAFQKWHNAARLFHSRVCAVKIYKRFILTFVGAL